MSTTGSQTTGPGIVPGPDQQVENAPGLLTLGSYLRRGQASADAVSYTHLTLPTIYSV